MTPFIFRLLVISSCGGLAAACGSDASGDGPDAGALADASAQVDGGPAFPVIVQLNHTERDFEGVPVGTTRELRFNVVNVSEGTIEFEAMSIVPGPGSDPAFEVIFSATRLARGNPKTVRLLFSPTELRPYVGEVVVQLDGAPSPQTVALRGSGLPSPLQLDPSRIDFGAVYVGTSVVRTLSITNPTGEDARYTLTRQQNLETCPSASGLCVEIPDRFLDPDDRLLLLAGSTKQLDVRLNAPDRNAAFGSGLELLKDGASEPIVVRLEGLSRDKLLACMTPGRLEAPPGACAPAQIMCTAHTNLAVTVRDWGRGENTGPDWIIAAGRRISLASGESFAIDIEFCPGRAGQSDGSLDIEVENEGQLGTETVGLFGLSR